MKVSFLLNKKEVFVTISEKDVQALFNAALDHKNTMTNAKYYSLNIADVILKKYYADEKFRQCYNDTAQGD
jgi:hypothetical protein